MDANYQLALANARMCGMKFSLEDCEGETLLGTSIELWNLIGRLPRSIGDEAKTFRVWGLDRSQLNDDECIERSKGAMALRAMEMGLVPLIVDCGFEEGDTLMIKSHLRTAMPDGANYDNPGTVCSVDDINPGHLIVSWTEGMYVRIPVYAAEMLQPQSSHLQRKVA